MPAKTPKRGWFHPQSLLDKTFEIGILLKGLDGVVELAGALLLVVVAPTTINRWAERLTHNRLEKDPNSFIAGHILQYAHELAGGERLFVIFFLLTHGIIKVILVVGLLRSLSWAYPFAFVALGGFVVYQVYVLAMHFTVGMFLLTLFDLFIIWLTWREYQKFKAGKLTQSIKS